MFPNKKKGDYLLDSEFEALEKWAFTERKHASYRLRVRSGFHAVAHQTLLPFSVFSLGTHVQSLPVPMFNTATLDAGSPLLSFSNGPTTIQQGDTFTPMPIGSTYPILARIDADNPPRYGWPCNARFSTRLERDDTFGLICLSDPFQVAGQDVVWVIRSNVKPKLSGISVTEITKYNRHTGVLGFGYAEVTYDGAQAYDPATQDDSWVIRVWNTHPCIVELGDTLELTPCLNVGFCVAHPEYYDEAC